MSYIVDIYVEKSIIYDIKNVTYIGHMEEMMKISMIKKPLIYVLIILAASGLSIQLAMNSLLDYKTGLYLLALILLVITCGRIKEDKKDSQEEKIID